MKRVMIPALGLLAASAAGAAAPSPPGTAADCVKRAIAGPPGMPRADAYLLCARPTAAGVVVQATWTTCAAAAPAPDEECETGSWTLRARTAGRILTGGLDPRAVPKLMSWRARGAGTLTCRWDVANTPPDIPGTPLLERFHRTGRFRVTTFDLQVAAGPRRFTLSAVGTAVGRVQDTCGRVIEPGEPTFQRSFPLASLTGPLTVRDAGRFPGTFGVVETLRGGPVRGTITGSASATFAR